MKLSVIIPVYNKEQYLCRCFDSLLKQINEDIEIIVVDDGSTDRSAFICDEYERKNENIKVIHQRNAGVGNARNVGMKHSEGEWITFLDADDYFDSNFAEYLNDYLDEKYELILFDMIIEDSNALSYETHMLKRHEFTNKDRDKFIVGNFLANCFIPDGCINLRSSWGKIYRRSFLLDQALYFDEGVAFGEDMIFMLRVYSSFSNAKYINRPLVHYFAQNEKSATNRYKPDMNIIAESYSKAIQSWISENEKYRKYYMNYKLDDIVLYLKYDFFNKENKSTVMENRERLKRIFCDGEYPVFYEESKRNGLIKNYKLSKRITFWLAVHGYYYLLKIICIMKYGNVI